jgi:hypothetical protein
MVDGLGRKVLGTELIIGNLIETHWKVKENRFDFEEANRKGSNQGSAAGDVCESACEKGFKMENK